MKTNNKGTLFVMSGPSGTGKGTICKELDKDENIYLSISYTTRDVRPGEAEGVNYYFVTDEEFDRMIRDDEMLEYARYGSNYYGTKKSLVFDALEEGKNVILEIEPQGALQIRDKYPEAVLIFVLPPSMEVLKERLIGRGRESMDIINERIAAAEWELQQQDKYDYRVVNDDLMTCVNEVLDILNKEERG